MSDCVVLWVEGLSLERKESSWSMRKEMKKSRKCTISYADYCTSWYLRCRTATASSSKILFASANDYSTPSFTFSDNLFNKTLHLSSLCSSFSVSFLKLIR